MSRPERVQALVVGGGVVGCAVLRELTRRGIRAILVEAEPDVGEGTSKANSAIVHTGFDARPGTLEATLLRRAAELWPEVVDALGVPFLALGAVMLARTSIEADRLRTEVAANAGRLGVPTEPLDRAALRDIAPFVTDEAVAALSIPGEAVVDPFWLTRAYAEAAVAGGAEVRLRSRLVGLHDTGEAIAAELADGTTLVADEVFDCAGLAADEVAAMVGDRSFRLAPRKGEFLVSEETFGVDRIVLPIPGPLGKGMLVTPIVFGGLLLGPTAEDVADRSDRSVGPAARERILAACSALVPALRDALPVRQFAGLRHVPSTGDYVVRPSTATDRLYLCAGIRSTGISTSPAVAERAVLEAAALRGWRLASPPRVVVPPPLELVEPAGEVVCPCRGVSRGEVLGACRRPLPATTLDGVKRRGGAMFGDCQGNLCAVEIARILAAERGLAV
ncbi:MAG TPA: FAD-dependent oxidoreductase, partial [Candidatus Limnocylindrales bacterium]|nr:FAD-dependent oxidoreductase [Candidatus Limnocylindrales bacterium]